MGLRILRLDLVGLIGGNGERFEVCELRRNLLVGEVDEPIDRHIFRDKDVHETICHGIEILYRPRDFQRQAITKVQEKLELEGPLHGVVPF